MEKRDDVIDMGFYEGPEDELRMLKLTVASLTSENRILCEKLCKVRKDLRIREMDILDEKDAARKSEKKLMGIIVKLRKRLLKQETQFTVKIVDLESQLEKLQKLFCDDDFVVDISGSKPSNEGIPDQLTPEKPKEFVIERLTPEKSKSKSKSKPTKRKLFDTNSTSVRKSSRNVRKK